ncbi:MAG: DUF2293 domain-containing protein [Bosea sp. (in: a-proteobacteria)]
MAGTKRQQEIRKALRQTAPLIPFDEAQDVLARAGRASMKELSPTVALWLSLASHVRHRHTDYDTLLDEGYERDAARHFVIDATDAKLTEWGCARRVADDAVADDEQDKPAAPRQRRRISDAD